MEARQLISILTLNRAYLKNIDSKILYRENIILLQKFSRTLKNF